MLYRSVNFWLLDLTASLLVFMSALYGKTARRTCPISEKGKEVSSTGKEEELSDERIHRSQISVTFNHFLLYIAYFAMMVASIVLFKSHPFFMIIVQHFMVILCVLVAFLQWFQPLVALFLGGLFSIIWIASASTTFRWILNNIVIGFLSLLVSHVQFQNFAFLQMFLWIAVLYDICLLKSLSPGLPSFFSAGECDTLICNAFEMNSEWELPTLFTFMLGPQQEHVFLGAGDIIIGCLVANFSQMFFKSLRYLSGTVSSYAIAIALLRKVEHEPYPALVTIVPLCSFQLVVSAILSHKTRKLFSFASVDNGVERKKGDCIWV